MQNFDDLKIKIGARIKEARLNKNISQESLAEIIGVCNGTHISNIERGLRGFSVQKLAEICVALDVDANYLLFGTTSGSVETELHNSLAQLNGEQSEYLLDIIRLYVKACNQSIKKTDI